MLFNLLSAQRGCHQPVLGASRVGGMRLDPNPSGSQSLCSLRENKAYTASASWEACPTGTEISWGGATGPSPGASTHPRDQSILSHNQTPGPDHMPLESQV